MFSWTFERFFPSVNKQLEKSLCPWVNDEKQDNENKDCSYLCSNES